MRFIILCLFAQFIPLSLLGQTDFKPNETEYLWPTSASKLASANFGETRSAHFHAALDVKTWGRSGYRVFATRDGILHRVGRSPFGYGNVIYLKHEDGSYSVYAHLERFIPKISKVVDSLRWANKTFVFNEYMESYGITFKKGDLIGFTGESGNGPPHLHFELRTPTESPFNPLITKIKLKDTRPPQFSRFAIEPLSIDAVVNGKRKIFTKKARRVGKNYDFGTIQVAGEVGLAVDVFDQADGAANVLAAYELKFSLDGELLFHSKIDSFSYDETREMFLDRVYYLLKTQNRGYQRLYRHDGNQLSFYQIADHKAKVRKSDGIYSFEIEALDFKGNSSKAFGKLKFENTSLNHDLTAVYNKNTKIETNNKYVDNLNVWFWQNDWVDLTNQNQTDLVIAPLAFGKPKYLVDQVIDLETYGSLILQSPSFQLPLYRVSPNVKTEIRTPDQRLVARFDEKSVYDTLSIAVGYYTDNNESIIYIYPEQEPLKKGFRISYLLNSDNQNSEKTSFYTFNRRTNRLDYIFSSYDDGEITARFRDFGEYKIYTDTIPPVISEPRFFKKANGKWAASVKGEDNLSGIDYNNSRFFVNGEEGILEYDPERDLILFYHPNLKAKRRNQLRLEVYDFEKNLSITEFMLDR